MREFNANDLLAESRLDWARVILMLKSHRHYSAYFSEPKFKPNRPLTGTGTVLVDGVDIPEYEYYRNIDLEAKRTKSEAMIMLKDLLELSDVDLKNQYEEQVNVYINSLNASVNEKQSNKLREDEKLFSLQQRIDGNYEASTKTKTESIILLKSKLREIDEHSLNTTEKYKNAVLALLETTAGLHPELKTNALAASWSETFNFLNELHPRLSLSVSNYRKYLNTEFRKAIVQDVEKFEDGVWVQVFSDLL